jgi:hypothetical protein
MLPAINAERCPGWRGIRSLAFSAPINISPLLAEGSISASLCQGHVA